MTEFQRRVQRMRHRRGMTQECLAGLCGLHPNTIRLLESGQRQPTCRTLCLLADIFDVSIDYLLGRTDDPRTAGKK